MISDRPDDVACITDDADVVLTLCGRDALAYGVNSTSGIQGALEWAKCYGIGTICPQCARIAVLRAKQLVVYSWDGTPRSEDDQ